jgi:hypothetical protein
VQDLYATETDSAVAPGKGQYRLTVGGVAEAIFGALHVHPGEGVATTKLSCGDIELCVVGRVIDYSDPQRTLEGTLAEVARLLVLHGPDGVASATRFLGGRWLLVWRTSEHTYAFQDPTGMMRLFFRGEGPRLVAGSDPRLVVCDDEGAGVVEAYARAMPSEYWWPGPYGPVAGVRQLLPNHRLCLETGEIVRCWPTGRLPEVSLHEGVRSCCRLLRSGAEGVSSVPGGLSLALSAGLDSRVTLAACRDFASDLQCFTFRYPTMDSQHQDLTVAAALARRFGLQHTVVETQQAMTPPFALEYSRRMLAVHEDEWGPLAEAIARSPMAGTLMLKGNPGGEIIREYYGPLRDEWVNPDVLRTIAELPDIAWVRQSLKEWHPDPVAGRRFDGGVTVANLFCWEQLHGCWQSMSQEEYGCAQETISLFNCRAIYETALSVAPRHRRRHRTAFQCGLVEVMWPELLVVSTNPATSSWLPRAKEAAKYAAPRAYSAYRRIRSLC